MKRFWFALGATVLLFIAGAVGGYLAHSRDADASRNSSGTMSAVNGPYVSGTTINSAQVNARFSDIETETTDSLSRSGKGPMLAPIRATNGTNGAPSITFDSDTDTGLYHVSADDLGVAVGGSKVAEFTTSGMTIPSGKSLTLPAPTVTSITPETNLAAGNGLGYWKDAVGIVHVKGSIQNNAGGAVTVLASTNPLAAGFRPSFTRQFVVSDSSSAIYTITINSGGAISGCSPALPAGRTVFLDGINFLGEA